MTDCGPYSSIQKPGDTGILAKGWQRGWNSTEIRSQYDACVKMSKGSSLEFMGNQEQERAVSTASHCQVKFKSKAQPGTQGSEWARKS